MLFGLCKKFLEWMRRKAPIAFNKDLRLKLTMYFSEAFGFTNVEDNETELKLMDSLKLEKRDYQEK